MTDLPNWAKPRKWMKNAVATNSGWKKSKTGELYKSHGGLKDKIDALTPAPVAKKETPAPKKKASKKKED